MIRYKLERVPLVVYFAALFLFLWPALGLTDVKAGSCTDNTDCSVGECCQDSLCLVCEINIDMDCTSDYDCPDVYCCHPYQAQACILCNQLTVDGDIDLEGSEASEDGDSEDGDSEGVSTNAGCESDNECGDGYLCRPEGYCVPEFCETNSDCIFNDFICREDGKCAPELCTLDSDCMSFEICLDQSCISDPASYVEGGVANCQSLSLSSRYEQLGVVIIGGLLLIWLRIRRGRAR